MSLKIRKKQLPGQGITPDVVSFTGDLGPKGLDSGLVFGCKTHVVSFLEEGSTKSSEMSRRRFVLL